MSDPHVIIGFGRSPIGAFNGLFKRTPAPHLAAAAVQKALAALPVENVSELFMGCVLPAGIGQAPARQVVAHAGLPKETGACTINRVCGSGMKALELAMHALSYKHDGVYIAGGMESMSMAPHLLAHSREGYRLGDIAMKDHVFVDGLVDASQGLLMGEFAEQTAAAYCFSRQDQDEFAQESLRRAQRALTEDWFKDEIAAVELPGGKDPVVKDEIPLKLDVERIPSLKPAFRSDGTVTAANASSLADGAAAIAVTLESVAKAEGYPILARVRAVSSHSQEPEKFTTAPIPAIQKLLDSQSMKVEDIDVWEINEAFATVPMAAIHDLGIDRERLNIGGGACALGHPLGATGSRIIVTLLGAMRRQQLKLGIASLCIGGGEGMAVMLELL